MNVPKNLTSILSVLSIVFSVVGFAFSPVSAAMLNPPSADGAGTTPHGFGIHGIVNATMQEERLQGMITQLSQKGVDVSQAQADFNAGNMTAALQYLREYLRANPGTGLTGTASHAWNTTALTDRLQTELTQLSQKGVDVSQPQADLTAGNLTAAFQWIRKYVKANPGTGMIGTRSQRLNSASQTGRLQTLLTQLSQKGVDVSQPQADLTAGNTTAALQWVHEYVKANPGTLPHATGGQSTGDTAWKGRTWFAGNEPGAGSQHAGNPRWSLHRSQDTGNTG